MAKKTLSEVAVDAAWKPSSSIQLEDDDCIDGCKVGGTKECTVKMKLTRDEVRKDEKKETRSQSWKVVSIESEDDEEEDEPKQSYGRGMK